MKPRSFLPLLLLLLTPLFTFSAPATAQGDAPSEFADIVDVRVMNLELVVTRRGERIEGLTSDDFRLLVNGEEYPIEYFSEIRYGAAVAPSQENEAIAVPALAPGEEVGTNILVFVDDVFSIAPYRNRVLKGLSKQIALLGPKDRMALVAFDGRKIELLSSWSRSERELSAALEEAIDRPTRGLLRRALDSNNDDFGFYDRSRFRNGLGAGYLGDPRFNRGGSGMLDLNAMIDAAAASMRAFANPEGRKVMLVLSGGWDPTIWDWDQLSSDISDGYFGPSSRLYGPLVDTANRIGYTLYPVEVGPLDQGIADASIGSLRQAEFVRERRQRRDWNQEGVLTFLADETGGRAYLDGAGQGALQRVQDDTSSYYWLGFTPDWQANDKRHRIEVVYKGQGKVRTRRSFTDLSRRTETTMHMESAQLFDLPMASKTDLVVHVGEAESAGFRKVTLPLMIEIPYDEITLLPGADGWSGRLELRVAVTDDRGDRADIPVVPIRLSVTGEPKPGAVMTYETGLKMRKRPHRLLVSLHDVSSGETLSTKLDVEL